MSSVVGCTACEIHVPASEIHTQERVVHALVRADRNDAQSRTPGSWNAGGAGGGMHCGRRLMGNSRSGFENFNLQNSKEPASGNAKKAIHDREDDDEEGKMQLLIFEGQI
jgi:hypothetical protein